QSFGPVLVTARSRCALRTALGSIGSATEPVVGVNEGGSLAGNDSSLASSTTSSSRSGAGAFGIGASTRWGRPIVPRDVCDRNSAVNRQFGHPPRRISSERPHVQSAFRLHACGKDVEPEPLVELDVLRLGRLQV